MGTEVIAIGLVVGVVAVLYGRLRGDSSPSLEPSSQGPFRTAAGSVERDTPAPVPTFLEPAGPFDGMPTVLRRRRVVYAAIVCGSPIALLNALVVAPVLAFGTSSVLVALWGFACLVFAFALMVGAVIGARVDDRQPWIPRAIAVWSVVHHSISLMCVVSMAPDVLGVGVCLWVATVAHAGLLAYAAGAEPVEELSY